MILVHTKEAPAAIGPYSQAVVHNGLVYGSGQIALDPTTMEIKGEVESQTKQVLKNLEAVLIAASSSKLQVIKTTIYLKNMNDFPAVNKIYANFFGDHKPARVTVEVSHLPKNALIEIDFVAVQPEK
jgi:2-iminobutanoate/2-iminopropanoate deaminase